MYVAIEGMDGVGKTTIAKLLAEKYGMEYIEKPMKKFMNVNDEYYNNLCNYMFGLENQDITLCFYMLGNLVTKSLGNDIIVDRNILSAYFWDCNDNNKLVFDYFFSKKDILPDLTIILYADVETRIRRIADRNVNDEDLQANYVLKDGYSKMLEYAEYLKMPYIMIDTTNLTVKEVFQICSDILEKIKENKSLIPNLNEKDNNSLKRTLTKKED